MSFGWMHKTHVNTSHSWGLFFSNTVDKQLISVKVGSDEVHAHCAGQMAKWSGPAVALRKL